MKTRAGCGGPGGDRVSIGFNRSVKTVDCETVTKRYK